MHTVGSAPREKKIPGLYSVAVNDDSEGNLSKRLREADAESIEPILTHYSGHRTRVTKDNGTGNNVYNDKNNEEMRDLKTR